MRFDWGFWTVLLAVSLACSCALFSNGASAHVLGPVETESRDTDAPSTEPESIGDDGRPTPEVEEPAVRDAAASQERVEAGSGGDRAQVPTQTPAQSLPKSEATREEPAPAPPLAAPVDPTQPLVIERGEGEQRLLIPRQEELLYDVELNLGWLGKPNVGKVAITTRVDRFRPNALLIGERNQPTGLEQAQLRARAQGSYAVYELDEQISSNLLPQPFPRLLYNESQSGTENRRRQVTLGERDGRNVSIYRRDGHCKGCERREHFVEPNWAWQEPSHCKSCKRGEHRVWRDPVEREVPATTLDMLGAVYLGRSMILDGASDLSFPLIDKEKLWNVRLRRGERRKLEVPAGIFDATEVVLSTTVPAGEKNRSKEDFEGLFGLHGNITMWFETHTGVPLWIRGVVTLGPIDLDVGVSLEKYRGTPARFAPTR